MDQGRGGYDLAIPTKELCALSSRTRLTEEELETLYINTQIDERYRGNGFIRDVEDALNRDDVLS